MSGEAFTRGRLLRAALATGAAAAGGAALGARPGEGTSHAAQGEAGILNAFLLLEYLQEDFYRSAVEAGTLDGELLEFATAVGAQESEHVAFLQDRLGSRAGRRPQSNFAGAVTGGDRFRATAIDLEEAAIGVYIGQGANLARDTVGPVATLLAVEARQAAWVRDLAGVSPAPRAADPAREAGEVLADLRRRGFVA